MIPRTSAFAWAATFLGLSGPFTEPMYFRARSSKVFALRGRPVIARMSDRFMDFSTYNGEFYYSRCAIWKMSKRKIIDETEVHEGSGNVYRGIGYPAFCAANSAGFQNGN